MLLILYAILPIFAIIALGSMFRHHHFPGEGFWEPAERLIYFVLLPCLFFPVTATADFSDHTLIKIPFAMAGGIISLTAILLALRLRMRISGAAFTSVVQGSIRFNSYVVLSAAAALFGARGITAVAMAVAFVVPLLNLISVAVLARYGTGAGRFDVRTIGLQLLKNPLVMSSLLGIAWNLLHIPMPGLLAEILKTLGNAGLSMGLLVVGAGLNLASVRGQKNLVLLTCGMKLFVMPMLVVSIAFLLGVRSADLQLAVLFASLPCATSAYILARQMGGDDTLMSAIIVMQTLAAVMTLPIILWVFK